MNTNLQKSANENVMENPVTTADAAAIKTALAEKPKRGLGRGLDALFADSEPRKKFVEQEPEIKSSEIISHASSFMPQASQRTLPITALIPTPFQPRKTFSMEDMASLVQSISVHGILQPLIVRPIPNSSPGQEGKYEIIGGERRWRAAQQAQLHEVPVIIKVLDDRQTLEIALVENIQRSDLLPVEEAKGYQRLITEFAYTQEELAKILGKSRSHIANMLRLLQLPEIVHILIMEGAITAGHARVLVGLDEDQIYTLAQRASSQKWSVRQLEKQVALLKLPLGLMPEELRARREARRLAEAEAKAEPLYLSKDADVLALEAEMGALLGLKVDIQSAVNGSGVLGIYFSSLDQLDELLQKMTVVKG